MPIPPVLPSLKGYRRGWLRYDLTSGLAIAAVGLPSAIAYPALAGLPPEVGLYSSIVPLLGYALLSPSRQIIVGPDAATVTMLAAVLLSFGLSSTEDLITASAAIALIVGLLCFLASILRLGLIANFLSLPILVGFMTGVSLTILVGQLGRFTGVKIESAGLLRPLFELAGKSSFIHWPSLALGGGLFVLLRLLGAWRPAIPGPLVAVGLATVLSAAFDFRGMGIQVVGAIPSQLPSLKLPIPQGVSISDLVLGALAVLIVSFGSGILTARSFATKNRYAVDANQELLGFGAANVASGLFGGFAVTATDSRTAINDLMGGKTQLAGIVSAVTLAIAVLFLSGALSLLPVPALGAVLASAAIGLIDLRTLRDLWRINRIELGFALLSIVGVVVLGVLKGVIVAIGATLLYLIMKIMKPRDALLGRIPGRDGFYKLHRHKEAKPIPGLSVYLLQGSLLFFNSDYVRERIEAILANLVPGTKWFIFDASATAQIDSTAAVMLEDVQVLIKERGLVFGVVDLHSEPLDTLVRSGLVAKIGTDMIFDDLEDAVAAFQKGRLEASVLVDSH
ncbi:SulP family inorganic anion transporter [Bosea vestrisii]|uniref:SulP family inorganic anion transporter n=1 Tax=Bosea vestrisii TaxID=151416 RepID=UPI0024E01B45|nr:SulP family inorganic anion transporter [Bosea vestrisii]WID94876.1 SulP family inorganic anion transporter [Bosea vestrisii]